MTLEMFVCRFLVPGRAEVSTWYIARWYIASSLPDELADHDEWNIDRNIARVGWVLRRLERRGVVERLFRTLGAGVSPVYTMWRGRRE